MEIIKRNSYLRWEEKKREELGIACDGAAHGRGLEASSTRAEPHPARWFGWRALQLEAWLRDGERLASGYCKHLAIGASDTWALFSSKNFCKIFQILRHIESLDICMKY